MSKNKKSFESDVFTVQEAMVYLKCSKPTLLKMLQRGLISYAKVGRSYRILKSEIDRYLLEGGPEHKGKEKLKGRAKK